MYRLVAFVAFLTLVGCASPVSLPVDNLAASARTPVEDLRPSSEGTREIFSLLITSERYGYARLAQDVTEPTGPRLFAHRLQEKYGTRTVPPTKLHHFAVYVNQRAQFRSMAIGVGLGGVVGAAIAGGTATREGDIVHTLVSRDEFAKSSGDEEVKRAQYTEAEVKAGNSVFVIFIESESQGQRRFTRTVSPIKPAEAGQKVPLHQAFDAAIHFHLNP